MDNQKLKEGNKSELLPTDNPLLTAPENAITHHNALSLSPPNFALQFFLGPFYIKLPREIEDNAYAKFWVTRKEHYGMLWYFLAPK